MLWYLNLAAFLYFSLLEDKEDKYDKRMERFDELFICFITYSLVASTNFIDSEYTKYLAGYGQVAFILLNFTIGLGSAVFKSCKIVCNRCRWRRLKKEKAKALKLRMKRDAEEKVRKEKEA